MNKNDKKDNFSETDELEQQHELIIKNKDLNKLNFLNLQHYYDIIKKLKKENISLSSDFIENFSNFNNNFQKPKYSPFSIKIRKDIKQISKHIYNKKNLNKKDKDHLNTKFIDKYKYIINSTNSVSSPLKTKNKKFQNESNLQNDKIPIKVYYIHNKDKNNNTNNNLNKTVNKENLRNNTVDSILYNNKTRIKFGYENYASNNINVNHPQIYILNSNFNNTSLSKEKLPLIESQNGFKYRKRGDLSCLIPFNTKKRKVRDNFYSYYIGMKLSKQKF